MNPGKACSLAGKSSKSSGPSALNGQGDQPWISTSPAQWNALLEPVRALLSTTGAATSCSLGDDGVPDVSVHIRWVLEMLYYLPK